MPTFAMVAGYGNNTPLASFLSVHVKEIKKVKVKKENEKHRNLKKNDPNLSLYISMIKKKKKQLNICSICMPFFFLIS